MGIVRLAKSLRLLNSIKEYNNRADDINDKIPGNRVYMDFVSIVYKIQETVAMELNYLLFSFMLIKEELININELIDVKFKNTIDKYKSSFDDNDYKKIIAAFDHIYDNSINIDLLKTYINGDFIDNFKKYIRTNENLKKFIYKEVINFIVDLLTQKLHDVEYVLIAFDGIPSYGKIQEQRQRRYMRYAFMEFKKNIIENSNNVVHVKKTKLYQLRDEYDREQFNVDIKSAIDYVYNMYHNGSLQNDLMNIIIRYKKNNNHIQKVNEKYNVGSSEIEFDNTEYVVNIEVIDREYGEGEKVLMDKLIDDYQKYGDNKSYVFYSPDGDSVILCLYIYIKHKINKLNVVKTYMLSPSQKHNLQSQYVDIPTLYNNIIITVKKFQYVSGQQTHKNLDTNKDKDSICRDFIFMINLYGNDFIHQIPTMEISTTFMDLLYIYAKFLRDNDYILKYDKIVNINFGVMSDFFTYLTKYEQYIMMDSYLVDVNDKNTIYKYFGDIFPHRYVIDYREKILSIKNKLYDEIKYKNTKYGEIKNKIINIIDDLNKIITVSGKKYGDIFIKLEVKDIDTYTQKIMENIEYLKKDTPKFIYNTRPKKNRDGDSMMKMINEIEKNLDNKPININDVEHHNDKRIRDFSFDYENIRLLIPHNQMPTMREDVDIFLLEWKSGQWTKILNAYNFNLGYDWKNKKIKYIDSEMKRYQYNMLNMNNTQLNKMITNYLKTISWMIDYYMNTNLKNTENVISTWAYTYDRSPFISHISEYLADTTIVNLRKTMKNIYNKSLVNNKDYISYDLHKFYIYPQSKEIIQKIPDNYKNAFPDMIEYVKFTIEQSKMDKNVDIKRVFDCRLCPYFSKCIFESDLLTFNELKRLKLPNDIINKISRMSVPNISKHYNKFYNKLYAYDKKYD